MCFCNKKIPKMIILLLVMVLVLFCSTSGQASNDGSWDEYSNRFFKIEYPADWIKFAVGDRVGFTSKDSSRYFGIDINQKYIGSFDNFKSAVKSNIKSLYSEVSQVKTEKILVDDQAAYKIEAENDKFYTNIFAVYKNKNLFYIQFLALKSEYRSNIDTVRSMVDSFKFYDFEAMKEKDKVVKDRKLTSIEALEDAEYLFDILEEVHPDIYRYYNKKAASQEIKQILKEIKNKKLISKKELFNLLAPYVALFKDGHTKLSNYDEYQRYLNKGGKKFPLEVIVNKNRLFVAKDLTGNNIPVATEILNINGFTSYEIIKKMKTLVSYDTPGDRVRRLENNFSRLLWTIYDEGEPFLVNLKMEQGKEKLIFLRGIEGKHDIKKATDYFDLSYPDEDVALLKIGTFTRGKEFKSFVDNSFHDIKEKGCQQLVIDIRDNGGGYPILASYLYEYITEKPYYTEKVRKIKLSDYVLENSSRYKLGQIAKLDNKEYMVFQNSLEKPAENGNRFNGTAYILIDKGTYSAAATFASMVKDFETGILIGEETGGYASNTGNVEDILLPYSGIKLEVATSQSIRPGGQANGRGVIQDVKIDVDSLRINQGKDYVLKRVLDKIKNEL